MVSYSYMGKYEHARPRRLERGDQEAMLGIPDYQNSHAPRPGAARDPRSRTCTPRAFDRDADDARKALRKEA